MNAQRDSNFELSCAYDQLAQKILERVTSSQFFEGLPALSWVQDSENLCITASLVCHSQNNVSKFFYLMMSRWLIPGKELKIKHHFSTSIQKDKESFTICELVCVFDHIQDFVRATKNILFLEKEILLGVSSSYHATKILEMKGLTLDEKTALIQEKIAGFVRHFPQIFDYDLFNEMQQFLITSSETFKAIRQTADLSRLIFTLYHFRKKIEKKAAKSPQKRHVCLKFKKTCLHTPFGLKEVLSIFGGINFLKEHELFEERHLLTALSHLIPGISSIPYSYYISEGNVHTFYLEIEKQNQHCFDKYEKNLLQKQLKREICKRVEQLVPPIFMPRNEEEVMRNILVLSRQLKYLRDLPQMMISFDEQTDTELSFTVVLVRILHSDSLPIRDLFHQGSFSEQISIDRVKLVGQLRRKYPKEACVLRVCLPSASFLREDYSVDVFKARLHLVKKIESILGEVRDYNGGMIAKQSENFDQLKKIMGMLAQKYPLLLQNFFHSIFPGHFSTTVDAQLLQILFSLFIEAMENSKESVILKSKRANDHLFVMTKFQDFSWKQKIFSGIDYLKLPSNELLSMQMQVFNSFYLGFIYLNPEKTKQQSFLQAIPESLSLLKIQS